MAHGSTVSVLGLLLLAATASATTVGPAQGKPAAGHPLEVNIPFAVDQPADRACASANVHYGNAPVPRMTLHVQGHGLKRNLLVTSRENVNEQPVTVNVRVGCGAKAVTRKFVLAAAMPAARPVAKPVVLLPAKEPLFPPAVPVATPQDTAMVEELAQARSDAAAAADQLEATRRELAAVLDVERRTSQTLIAADHESRDARSEVARMRLVLELVGVGLGLVAAGLAWFEFNRVLLRQRVPDPQPTQEPVEMPT
jgi:hypothetical protein